MAEDTEHGIKIMQALHRAFGDDRQPGTCPDCWGHRVIPSTDPTAPEGAWIECPTCRGGGQGGVS